MDALPTGDLAYLVYLLVFAAAAAGCLAGAWWARRQVSLPGVRRGLVGLLSASGLWALCHVGVLLSPGLGLKVALYETGLVVGFGTVFAWLWLCSAYSGRALHRRPSVRWAALILFLAVTATKLTNPWHDLYFSAKLSAVPFRHLEVNHHVIYWLTSGLSYALAAVGFFMLSEPLRRAQVGGGKLAGLFGLTALPLGANAIGYATPYLVDLSHEPVGVAAFALGAFALKRGQLEEASRAGREERPSLVLSAGGRVQNYNQAAAELLSALREGTSKEGTPQEETPKEGRPQEEEIVGRHLKEALPRLGRALNGESPGTEPSGTEPSGAELSGKNPSGKNPSGKEPEESRELEDNEELRENGRRSEEKFSAEKPSAEEKLLEVPAGGGEARYYRPVESQAGRGAGRLVVLQDVTERELRRRERVSRLEALFNQSPDMINVHDAEGRILEANPRFFEKTGHEEEDLQGMKVWDLDRSISREEALELWAGMEPGDRRRLEGTYRRKDGSAFPVEVDIRRLRLEGKGQFMAISRDITDRKVAERKLRRERDRLETLFESLPSPVVRCRAEGGRAPVEEANPAFAEIFGAGREEAKGQDLNDLLVPAGQKDAAAEIDRRAVEEGPAGYQVRRKVDGGEVRDFQLQVAGRQPEEGPPEIYAIYTDITDRKRREQELRESRRKLRREKRRAESITENVSDGIYRSTEEGIVYANSAFIEMFGYRDLQELREAGPEALYIDPSRREELIEKEHRDGRLRQEEVRYRRKDGTVFVGLLSSQQVEGEEEGRTYFDGAITDITKQRRQKKELKRKNDLFRRAQEIANVGAWEHDLQAGENRWTREVYRIYGYEEAVGPVPPVENGVEFYHPEDRPAVRSAFEKAVEEGKSFDIEARLIAEDGEEKWVRARGEPQWEDGSPDQEDGSSEGEVARVRGTLQDITGRKEQEEALRAAKERAEEARQEAEQAKEEAEQAKEEAENAQRMQSAFLANMSHEIRTPLTSIIGFAEMAGSEASELELPESALPRYASVIEQSGKRLLETLNGVLNLSKLQAGQMEMEAGSVDLPKHARLAAEELRPEAEEKEIGLELETGGGPAALAEADEGGVQIVLRNLLSNAIKYTDEGGVTVRTYREDRGVAQGQEDGQAQEDRQSAAAVLEVEDSGIGMDPEVVGKLFDPFRQASEGLSREYEGTGIGLAVTREAVDQMGGSIEVETEKGAGTCMTVRLPLAGETEAA
ncbi:PAS domain S-box protein [Salinibacter ruber]|uniref:sensor histidine kinase n=1 Tax=Salinibacter ruber TaxID=146919 RepID=UPI000E56B380|nr:PAS domain S-box protein [Salinibacter ruber]